MDESIEQLARDLAFAKYSKDTQERYVRRAEEYAKHCNKPPSQTTRDDVRAYVDALVGRERSSGWACRAPLRREVPLLPYSRTTRARILHQVSEEVLAAPGRAQRLRSARAHPCN